MPDPVPAAPATPAAPAAPVAAAPAAAAAPASPAPAGAAPPAVPAAGATPAAQPAAPATPEPPKPGEPAAPAFDIKVPDGVKVDQPLLDGAKSIMSDTKTTPQQKLQALVDLQLKNAQESQKTFDKTYQENLQKQRVADLDAVKADPKLGGANFDKTVQQYRAAVQKFGGEELKKMLEASGYDCHPAIVRTFQAISAAIGEDATTSRLTHTTTTDPGKKPMSQTERMAARYTKPKSAQQ